MKKARYVITIEDMTFYSVPENKTKWDLLNDFNYQLKNQSTVLNVKLRDGNLLILTEQILNKAIITVEEIDE